MSIKAKIDLLTDTKGYNSSIIFIASINSTLILVTCFLLNLPFWPQLVDSGVLMVVMEALLLVVCTSCDESVATELATQSSQPQLQSQTQPK